MNFFAHETAAQRYAQSRPYFHPLVMEKIKAHLALDALVSSAETIPLKGATFDLITVSLAFHWFDRAAFWREARRLSDEGTFQFGGSFWLLESAVS